MALAIVAAAVFAVGATVQSSAVGRAVSDHGSPGSTAVVGNRAMGALLRNRDWWASVGIIVVGGVIHAAALTLAPISIVQPIGVLAIPFAVVLTARRQHRRPPLAAMLAVGATMAAVLAFVLAAASDGKNAHYVDPASVAWASLGIGAVAAVFAVLGIIGPAWIRCLAWAAAGAMVYGLGSGLLRTDTMLIAQGDLLTLHVFGYTASVIGTYLLGGWFIQHAHSNGPPAVVLGSLTVIDPIVAVVFGMAFLGEGAHLSPLHTTIMAISGLVAAIGVVLLAKYHPEGDADPHQPVHPAPGDPLPAAHSREEHTP